MNRKQRALHRLRNGGRRSCRYCQETARNLLTLEHLTPLARGGTWNGSNLDVSCFRCNMLKGKRTDAEFFDAIEAAGGVERMGTVNVLAFVRARKKNRRVAEMKRATRRAIPKAST